MKKEAVCFRNLVNLFSIFITMEKVFVNLTDITHGQSKIPKTAGGNIFFLLQKRPDQLWSLLNLIFNGHRFLLSGVNWLGRYVEHSSHSVRRL
jgi:hypothetical protein